MRSSWESPLLGSNPKTAMLLKVFQASTPLMCRPSRLDERSTFSKTSSDLMESCCDPGDGGYDVAPSVLRVIRTELGREQDPRDAESGGGGGGGGGHAIATSKKEEVRLGSKTPKKEAIAVPRGFKT